MRSSAAVSGAAISAPISDTSSCQRSTSSASTSTRWRARGAMVCKHLGCRLPRSLPWHGAGTPVAAAARRRPQRSDSPSAACAVRECRPARPCDSARRAEPAMPGRRKMSHFVTFCATDRRVCATGASPRRRARPAVRSHLCARAVRRSPPRPGRTRAAPRRCAAPSSGGARRYCTGVAGQLHRAGDQAHRAGQRVRHLDRHAARAAPAGRRRPRRGR